jgi:hypothetical protein
MNTDDFDTKTPGVFEQTAPTDSEKIGEKYGTQHDRKDMNRLGKLQQLRVRYVFRSSWRHQLTAISPLLTEKLSFPFDSRICPNSGLHLGICSSWDSLLAA